MKVHKWRDIRNRRGKLSTADVEAIEREVEREVFEMTVSELRKELGLTQEEVARAAEMTQSELSRSERRGDHLVSSLRRMIEALGGELRITAKFKDKEVELRGV